MARKKNKNDAAADDRGMSLVKAPTGIVGLVLLAYGLTALIFGGNSFQAQPVSGDVMGEPWLGIATNGWSSLLFAASGALLLLAAPLHWGAKTMSLVVGLVLGAASVIALWDGQDVFGIFAANGWMLLAWGAASVVLLVLALLPRTGGRKKEDARHDDGTAHRDPRP